MMKPTHDWGGWGGGVVVRDGEWESRVDIEWMVLSKHTSVERAAELQRHRRSDAQSSAQHNPHSNTTQHTHPHPDHTHTNTHIHHHLYPTPTPMHISPAGPPRSAPQPPDRQTLTPSHTHTHTHTHKHSHSPAGPSRSAPPAPAPHWTGSTARNRAARPSCQKRPHPPPSASL